MPAPTDVLLFCGAALVLLVIPGPSVVFIVTRSVEHGRRAGLVSVVGVHAGSVVHVLAAALGLSALVLSSALAFAAVKYAGAAYLVFLGVRRWRSGGSFAPGAPTDAAHLPRLFYEGFVVNVLNPKTALFFLAFLPQFVDPGRGPVPLQVLTFGLLFIALGICSDGTYALAGSAVRGWLRRRKGAGRIEPLVSGSIYVGLGVTAAVSGSHARS
jgi:threonine/homoserine/homoserine lactone efflux protein